MELGSYRLAGPAGRHRLAMLASFATVAAFAAVVAPWAAAGGLGGLGRGAVGGVMIDGQGVVRSASLDEQHEFANRVRSVLDAPSGDLNEASELRVISLKGIQTAIGEARSEGRALPDEVSLLAGLQRVEYVVVDREGGDVLIGGPAEPWEMLDDGSIVGKISGGATLRLDDLAVALRSVEAARDGLITCSIEPTAEGRRQLRQFLRTVNLGPSQDPSSLVPGMKQAFGPQQVKLNGVAGNTRMARTLVAADFEMKRIAMGLIESPVKKLPSYLQMARNATHSKSSNPRWWMACDYDDLRRSDDGLAWKLSGRGVRTMTETEIQDAAGNVAASGKQDRLATKWAELMTDQFDELAKSITVFSDLRNTMDLNVVATLIVQEGLASKAGLDLNVLISDGDSMDLDAYAVPKQIPPHCSFIRGNGRWTVTASGGVEINAFEVVQRQTTDASLAHTRTGVLAARSADRWWWNR